MPEKPQLAHGIPHGSIRMSLQVVTFRSAVSFKHPANLLVEPFSHTSAPPSCKRCKRAPENQAAEGRNCGTVALQTVHYTPVRPPSLPDRYRNGAALRCAERVRGASPAYTTNRKVRSALRHSNELQAGGAFLSLQSAWGLGKKSVARAKLDHIWAEVV
jgi:hypothetical protein